MMASNVYLCTCTHNGPFLKTYMILYNTCVIFLGGHYIENIIFSTDIMENAYPNVTLGTWLHGSTVTHSIKMLRNIYPTL